jgi:outer membrane protein OmpA-like peptidoglycan-associated protein
MIRTSLFTALILCSGTLLPAQVDVTRTQSPARIPPARLGVYGGINLNNSAYQGSVWNVPGSDIQAQFMPFMNDSLMFSSGSVEAGLHLGFTGGYLITPTIHFSGRVGYNGLGGSATASQRRTDSTVQHEHLSTIGMFEATPAFEFYDLVPGVSVHPIIGLEIGMPVVASFTQSGTFTAPSISTATFQTFNRDVDVPNTTVRAALMLGLGYTMKIGRSTWLQPEISYRIPLTNISSATPYSPWKVSQIRFGVNVTWGQVDPELSRPRQGRPMTAVMDRIVAYDEAGREVPVERIVVEDVAYTEMFPLVPYVFMPVNGSTPDTADQHLGIIPEKGDFVPEGLPLDAIEVNKNLLNIIGSRMKRFTHATLGITGTLDVGAEGKSIDLAQARAEWAKSYLMEAFQISPERIVAKGSTAPQKASTSSDPDGIAENRRVEFSSNVPDVLKPLVITADNQRMADPDLIVFHTTVDADDSIATWSMRISQAGRPLRDMSGIGTPGPQSWSIRPNELSNAQVPIDWEFYAMDLTGDTALITGSLPVEYASSVRKRTERLPDKTIDKYSLILFDFNKSSLTEDNARILEQMVLPSIKANSTVTIVGYTDRIGIDSYNEKLAVERAATVRAFLTSRAKDASYSSYGVGEASQIFTNDLPLGRQLSRTVQVLVETPRR